MSKTQTTMLQTKVPSSLMTPAQQLVDGTIVVVGYRVHGTMGILIRAIRRHQLIKDEVITLLRQLPTLRQLPIQSTLHIRPSLLQYYN